MNSSQQEQQRSHNRLNVLCDHLQLQQQTTTTLINNNSNNNSLLLAHNETMAQQDNNSLFGNVPVAAPDPILGLSAAFRDDKSSTKVNLGVGAYRTNEGNPFVLEVVRKVRNIR